MKGSYTNNRSAAFSILEVVIALALVMVVVTGALSAQFMADYWTFTSQLSTEALSILSDTEGALRVSVARDFYTVSSTELQVLVDGANPLLTSCTEGGICYALQNEVEDISPCAKLVTSTIEWSAGARYATSSVFETSRYFNQGELINRGGDCQLQIVGLGWKTAAPVRQVSTTTIPLFTTGMDVLHNRIYVVASSSPMLRIYERPVSATTSLQLLHSSTVLGNRLNAIDVIRDTASGRLYAYVVQHTRTEQLVVLDVTDDSAEVVATRSLVGTDAAGSFPQGWRVVAYGKRLYVTTRETAGAELHIFNISNPTNPLEISGGAVNMARTVNDMVVREQRVGSVVRRYLFLAASAALKEFALYEVTGDVPIERVAFDLPGTENALSIFLNGDTVYLGRQQTAAGPELYQYRVSKLLLGSTTPQATSEVGADVHTIRGIGTLLLVGTNKSTAELQTWRATPTSWNPHVINAARISASSAQRLAPLGMDISSSFLYTTTQSQTQSEQVSVWSAP